MQIQSLSTNRAYTSRNRGAQQQVAFRATPNQILAKTAEAANQHKICGGKAGFLTGLANYFKEAQNKLKITPEAPDKFDYQLGQRNEMPKAVKDLNVAGGKFGEIDESLNDSAFSCGSGGSCACGKGSSLGEFAAALLKHIGVEKPDTIELSKR